jgi:hypothetical protein
MDSSYQYSAIHSWLAGLYHGNEVPEFELNAETLSLLQQLQSKNFEKDKQCNLLIKDAMQHLEEYKAENSRLSHMLDPLLSKAEREESQKESTHSNHNDLDTALECLASLAVQLQLKNGELSR